MKNTTDLRQAFAQLKQDFPGYDEITIALLLALLMQQHLVIIGEKGTGKTQYIMSAFGMFQGAPIYRGTMNLQTTLDDLFGQPVVNLIMSEGKTVRNTEGGLLSARFALLNELLDLPDMILRGALLDTLNERAYRTKDQTLTPIPLHTMAATTNFQRANLALDAVWDRILFKCYSPRVRSFGERMGMYDTFLEQRASLLPSIDYDELAELSALVALKPSEGGVQIDAGFKLLHGYLLDAFELRRREMAIEKLRASLRREPTAQELAAAVPAVSARVENQELDVARAIAVLYGRDHVVLQDLQSFKYVELVTGQDPDAAYEWDNTCNTVIPTKKRDVELLEFLGRVAESIHQLTVEEPRNTASVNIAGGRMPTATLLQVKEWLSKLSGKMHPTNMAIIERLKAEVNAIGAPHSVTSLSLESDWVGAK